MLYFSSYSAFWPQFAFTSPPWKQTWSNWSFDTMYRMVSVRSRLLFSVIWSSELLYWGFWSHLATDVLWCATNCSTVSNSAESRVTLYNALSVFFKPISHLSIWRDASHRDGVKRTLSNGKSAAHYTTFTTDVGRESDNRYLKPAKQRPRNRNQKPCNETVSIYEIVNRFFGIVSRET